MQVVAVQSISGGWQQSQGGGSGQRISSLPLLTI